MTLRALVVEDEWATRHYLVELLHGAGVEVVGAVASADDARDVLASGEIDAAFVDVQLVGGAGDDAGLALVRAHAGTPGAPVFVLATAHGQHALEAYQLGVVDYLLKPFTEARVAECVGRVTACTAARAAPSAPARIVGRRKRALVFVRLDDVWAYEAADRLARVHTARGVLDVDLSLSAVEATFGRTFVRVHRNWLVNAAHVRELDGVAGEAVVVVGDEGLRVPVARDRAASVRELLLANAPGIRAR